MASRFNNSTSSTPFWSPNTLDIYRPIVECFFLWLLGLFGEHECFHCLDCSFASGISYRTHVWFPQILFSISIIAIKKGQRRCHSANFMVIKTNAFCCLGFSLRWCRGLTYLEILGNWLGKSLMETFDILKLFVQHDFWRQTCVVVSSSNTVQLYLDNFNNICFHPSLINDESLLYPVGQIRLAHTISQETESISRRLVTKVKT